MSARTWLQPAILIFASVAPGMVLADPCGMVPPIYQGQGIPIARIGVTRTRFFRALVQSLPADKMLGPVLNESQLAAYFLRAIEGLEPIRTFGLTDPQKASDYLGVMAFGIGDLFVQ